MKYNYCTLFNHHYLTRGLAMYESLLKHTNNFHLYILCFDDITHDILVSLHLSFVTLIKLSDFENEDLKKAKTTRSMGEYCWTCSSSTILYCMNEFKLEYCTYIDADLYFFSDPNILIDEMKSNSVLITGHNYTKKYDQSLTSGKFCVQFVTFKNDEIGLKVLTRWINQCLDWCYDRIEDGKFGDQKYLDSWPSVFPSIHVVKNIGILGPFNIGQYRITQTQSGLQGRTISTNETFIPVFYHFHNLSFINKNKIDLGLYELHKNVISHIYTPYISHLINIRKMLDEISRSYNYHGTKTSKISWKSPLRALKRYLLGVYNVYNINDFIK